MSLLPLCTLWLILFPSSSSSFSAALLHSFASTLVIVCSSSCLCLEMETGDHVCALALQLNARHLCTCTVLTCRMHPCPCYSVKRPLRGERPPYYTSSEKKYFIQVKCNLHAVSKQSKSTDKHIKCLIWLWLVEKEMWHSESWCS